MVLIEETGWPTRARCRCGRKSSAVAATIKVGVASRRPMRSQNQQNFKILGLNLSSRHRQTLKGWRIQCADACSKSNHNAFSISDKRPHSLTKSDGRSDVTAYQSKDKK
jgi:hypothetical protein